MAIYFTQILNKETKRILTGTFSLAGLPLKSNQEKVLVDLKQTIPSIPLDKKIFCLHSQDKVYLFFYKITNNTLIASICDNRTTDRLISKYFDEIEKAFVPKDYNAVQYDFDDKLKTITDNFNKKSKMLLGVEELETTHTQLVENLDKVIKRGENINNLQDLAEKVNFQTREMSKKVQRMKLNAQYERYKIHAIIAIVILLFIFIYLKFLR